MSRPYLALAASALTVLSCQPAQAASATADCTIPPQAGKQADAFFGLLQQGKNDEAVASILNTSPLWQNRTGAKEQIAAQIDAAGRIYGAVGKYELASCEALGTSIVRGFYFLQYDQIVVRWEFDWNKTNNGWSVAYFGFTDQVQSWF